MKNIASILTMLFICSCGLVVAQYDVVVYDEIPLNYPWSGYMGEKNGASLDIDTTFGGNPGRGDVCAKISYDRSIETWTGLFIQSDGTWNCGPGIGLNLVGLQKLRFYAKGERGGEIIKFGFGYDQPNEDGYTDSTYARKVVTLTPEWKEINFTLTGKDLSHINGVVMFSVDKYNNPYDVTFYLDNVTYVMEDTA